MELVLRYAQDHMRPSQVAVVCQNSGRRYRWFSLVCLILLLVTGLALAREFDLHSIYGKVLTGLVILWTLLLAVLALLSFYIHPAMHIRVSSAMTEEEIRVERQRVASAIVKMDITVRLELGLIMLALLAGASLHMV